MEKRSIQRIRSNRKIKFSLDNEFYSGTISDLSENGMFINSKTLFPLKSEFNIYVPVREKVVSIPVKVSRLLKEGDKYDGMGVEFINPPDQYLELLSILKWSQSEESETGYSNTKKFVCSSCYHVAFHEAPTHCPFCRSSIDDFNENPRAVRLLSDFPRLDDFEKQHFPVITIAREHGFTLDHKGVDIYVKIGEIKHLMEVDDRITFIDFYFDEYNNNKRCIARVSLNCKNMNPEAAFRLNNISSGILTVASNCNAHGTWMTDVKI